MCRTLSGSNVCSRCCTCSRPFVAQGGLIQRRSETVSYWGSCRPADRLRLHPIYAKNLSALHQGNKRWPAEKSQTG
jgi:hypothetical protein